MAKKVQFPKELYVTRANQGTQDEYLACDEDVSTLLEQAETVKVARYVLVETCDGFLSPEIRNIRQVKR